MAERTPARDPMMPWLAGFPDDWGAKRLKRAVERITYKAIACEQRYIGLEHIESWSGRLALEPHGDEGDESDSVSQLFAKGDVLFGKLRPYLAKVLLANEPGRCSSELLVLRGRDLLPEFLRYLLLSNDFISLVDSSTYGAKMPRAEWNFIGQTIVPVPPKPTQKTIADFLDRKTSAIDAFIAKKERLIELITEKDFAIVTQAATVGFDPNITITDSRIPHLGRVASSWEIQPLRHRLRRIEQGWSPECENRQAEASEWGVLKVGCVNGGVFNEAENKALPRNLRSVPELEVHCGDVLVSRANTRELAGSVALVMKTRPKLLLCDKLFRLKYRAESVDPGYLALALRSAHARWQIEREATGASDSMQNIGQDTLKRLVLAWPRLEEQKRIANKMYEFERRNSELAARIGRQIQLLREYRQALITAAVTGQADIPKHAEAA